MKKLSEVKKEVAQARAPQPHPVDLLSGWNIFKGIFTGVPGVPIRTDLLGGVNPWMAQNVFSKTQCAMPPYEGPMQPVHLPLTAKGKMGDGKPVHVVDMLTRGELVNDHIAGDFVAGLYSNFFYAFAYLALAVIAFLFIHVYLAAVFIYLSGTRWSEYKIGVTWGPNWWANKMLVHTA